MLDQAAASVASFTGDSAHDQDRLYASVAQHHPAATVSVPPRATAVLSDTAKRTQRDCHLQLIVKHGQMGWQKASGYNARARAEVAISSWKQVIGNGLRSRTDERRATEMRVAHALNRMLELGRPSYVRVA